MRDTVAVTSRSATGERRKECEGKKILETCLQMVLEKLKWYSRAVAETSESEQHNGIKESDMLRRNFDGTISINS